MPHIAHIDFEPMDWAEFDSGPVLDPGYRSAVLASGPKLYCLLDEASGVTAANLVGGDGTYGPNSGGAWTGGTHDLAGPVVQEAVSTQAAIDGSSGRIELGNVDDGLGAQTFAAWIRPTQVDVAGGLLHMHDASLNTRHGVTFDMTGTDVIGSLACIIYRDAGGYVWERTGNVLTPNVWQFIAVTTTGVDAAGHSGYFVNGGAVAGQLRTALAGGGPLASDGPWWIGKRSGVGIGFPGGMAHVAWWDRVLDAAEIESLYQRAIQR